MDLEDFLEPEIALSAVIAATLFSPRGRKLLRQGVVYSTAGVLIAGDAIANFTRGIGQGMRRLGVAGTSETQASSGDEQPAGQQG